MKVACRMCDRPVRISIRQWFRKGVAFCPPDQVDSCIATFQAMNEEPPDEDPEDRFEPEPVDIWVCSTCRGQGEVAVRQDWETGAIEYEGCSTCKTTGVQPGYAERLFF